MTEFSHTKGRLKITDHKVKEVPQSGLRDTSFTLWF